MTQTQQIKKRLILLISTLVILAIIGIIIFIAYNAERQGGVKIGAANYYLSNPSKNMSSNNQNKSRQIKSNVPSEAVTENSSGDNKPKKVHFSDKNKQNLISKASQNKRADLEPAPTKRKIQTNYTKDTKNIGQKKFFAFSSNKKLFAPSTLGIIEKRKLIINNKTNKSRKKTSEEKIHLYLKGTLSKEMFIFNIYNDVSQGKLKLYGSYKIIPQGKETKEKITALFYYSSKEFNNVIQLPVLFNAKISPKIFKNSSLFIDKEGKLHAKNPVYKDAAIEYTITRTTENSHLEVKQPLSESLKKEFSHIPLQIKKFLDLAKSGSDEYKMLFVNTLFKKFFGYQKDILPVKLSLNTTWCSYLNRSIANNHRLIADCDVLSTYAFIFCRYLDLNTVVCAGYNNSDAQTLDTLDSEEYHAALLSKINEKWVFFDPSYVSPDLSETALTLSSAKNFIGARLPSPYETEQMQDEQIYADQKYKAEPKIQQKPKYFVKYFSVPQKAALLLGSSAFEQNLEDDEISSFNEIIEIFKNNSSLVDYYKNKNIFSDLTSITIRFCLFLIIISFIIKETIVFILSKNQNISYINIVSPTLLLTFIIFVSTPILCMILRSYKIIFPYIKTTNVFFIITTILTVLSCILLLIKNISIILITIKKELSPTSIWKKKSPISISRNPDALAFIMLSIAAIFYCPNWFTLIFSTGTVLLNHYIIIVKEKFYATYFIEDWKIYSKVTGRYL